MDGSAGTRRATLGALVDLVVRLDRDREVPEPQRRQRDRAIGQQLEPLARRPVAQTLAWLDAVQEEEGETPPTAGRWMHRAGVLIVMLGLLLGAGVAGGVFYYDGTRPVNVIHVLAVFVFLQLLTVVLTILAALPARVTRWLPGMRSVQEALWLFSPGRLAALVVRRLPQRYRGQAEQLLGHARSHSTLYRGVQQWAILAWSQSFAVAFNLAALATALALITFSDLAFGWSTTLRVDAQALAKIVQALAWPWAWAWREAVPEITLIEASQYYRFGDTTMVQGGRGPAVAALLGQWWPFVVMCMAVYGLLPRLVLLAIALHQRKRAVVAAIEYHPAARRLLQRMNEPIVTTREPAAPKQAEQAEQPEQPEQLGHVEPEASRATGAPTDWPHVDGPTCVIDWAQVPVEGEAVDRLLSRWSGALPQAKVAAGGAHSVDADARAIERAVGVVDEVGMVVMLVRGWEPPMAEVTDFLAQLRRALPQGRPIVVMPIGTDERNGQAVPVPTAANLAQWQRRLDAVGDPWLHVVSPGS